MPNLSACGFAYCGVLSFVSDTRLDSGELCDQISISEERLHGFAELSLAAKWMTLGGVKLSRKSTV